MSAPGAGPGNWFVTDVRYRRDCADWRNICDELGNFVCCLHSDTHAKPPIAHLIAASPAQYDALVEARDSLAAALIYAADGLFDEQSVGEHLVIAKIDGALALARGEAA